jgi:spermidine synthase
MISLLRSKKGLNIPTILLASSMFFTGASGFIIQNILSVTASSILGNTFVQFGITTSLMLGSMGIGGALQKYIKNNLLEKFVLVEMFLVLLTGFAPIGLYYTYAVMPEHFTLIQYTWITMVGLLIGFEIPLISRINEKYQPDLSENLASIVTMDYIGSMVGGIVWTFFFLGKMDVSTSAFLTAFINMGVALMTYFYFVNLGKKKVNGKIVLFLIFCITAISIAPFYVTQWRVDLQQRLFDNKIVFNQTTKYQNLVLTHNNKIDDYRLFINGNLQFSSLDEKIYHENLVHPVMTIKKQHKNVLVLGGGDGMAVRELLKYDDVENITLVDLDKGMIDLFKNDPILTKLNDSAFYNAKVRSSIGNVKLIDLKKTVFVNETKYNTETQKFDINPVKLASVNVFTLDAYNFVKDFDDVKYDVVIIDFPDPSIIELNKLYTTEFFIHLRSMVKDDTMIVIQSTSPYHAKEAYLCIGRTMEGVGFKTIPFHDNVPTFGDWGWYLAWSDNTSKDEMYSKLNNIDKFGVDELSYITPEIFKSNLHFGKNVLMTSNKDVNTLMNPVLINYYVTDGWKIE